MSTVLQEITLNLLRSLYQFSNSPEFQVALSQFYDSTEKGACMERLRGTEFRKFIDLLDDVSQFPGTFEPQNRF